MLKRLLLAVLVLLLPLSAAPDARAQESFSAAIDATRFKVAPAADVDLLGTQRLQLLRQLEWSAGLIAHYAHRPLQFNDDGEISPLISSQTMAEVLFAIGVVDTFEVGVGLPVMLYQDGAAAGFDFDGVATLGSGLSGTSLGDLRITPRFLFQEADGLRLGISGTVYLPTGDDSAFLSDGSFGVGIRLLLDYTFLEDHVLALNVGSRTREARTSLNLLIGQELTFNLAYRWDVPVEAVDLELMSSFETAVITGQLDAQHAAAELLFGARLKPTEGLSLLAGIGPGLSAGFGTPAFRAFLGAAYAVREPPPPPIVCEFGEGEDFDGFLDEDGCADPDNDEDGIPDVEDRCPLEAESLNDIRDEDGCPEPPVGASGEADTSALPPLEASVDSDGDGLMDDDDLCPQVPEDKDGFEDADGCPEEDNDSDGIPDDADQCPLQAEVINGVEDTDGCPDEGESKIRLTRSNIQILESIQFETSKATIRPESFPILDQVAAVLSANAQITGVLIEGHTDDRGDEDDNLTLSRDRAKAVRDYLIEKGVEAQRLQSEGYGESRPVAPNDTREGRAQNRRVEFRITEVDGQPYEPPADTDEVEVPQ